MRVIGRRDFYQLLVSFVDIHKNRQGGYLMIMEG